MKLSNEYSSASLARWLTLHSWTLNSQTACSVNCLQDNSWARTPRKTPSSFVKNACLLVRYLAMDECEPYIKHFLRHWFYCYVRVFRPLPRNRSTCHNMNKKFLRLILPRLSGNLRLPSGFHILWEMTSMLLLLQKSWSCPLHLLYIMSTMHRVLLWHQDQC
jgi:hypothetical protein